MCMFWSFTACSKWFQSCLSISTRWPNCRKTLNYDQIGTNFYFKRQIGYIEGKLKIQKYKSLLKCKTHDAQALFFKSQTREYLCIEWFKVDEFKNTIVSQLQTIEESYFDQLKTFLSEGIKMKLNLQNARFHSALKCRISKFNGSRYFDKSLNALVGDFKTICRLEDVYDAMLTKIKFDSDSDEFQMLRIITILINFIEEAKELLKAGELQKLDCYKLSQSKAHGEHFDTHIIPSNCLKLFYLFEVPLKYKMIHFHSVKFAIVKQCEKEKTFDIYMHYIQSPGFEWKHKLKVQFYNNDNVSFSSSFEEGKKHCHEMLQDYGYVVTANFKSLKCKTEINFFTYEPVEIRNDIKRETFKACRILTQEKA